MDRLLIGNKFGRLDDSENNALKAINPGLVQ